MRSHTGLPGRRDSDCCRAHVVADCSGQGWCRLCNGIILFDDGHYLTPDGHDGLVSLCRLTALDPRTASWTASE